MKTTKKQQKPVPEVHILGDLQDVGNLIKVLNKKNVIVVFKDEEQGTFHLEIEGKIRQIVNEDTALLEKEYRLIYFSFFPSRKRVEPVTEEKIAEIIPEKKVKKEKKETKEKKEKKEMKKVAKGKKGKKK